MKKLKRMMALVIAMAMVLSLHLTAFATDVGNVSLDTSVSVSGLQTGDSVNFYQIVKWVDGTGWAWINSDYEAALATAAASFTPAKTAPVLTTITGTTDKDLTDPNTSTKGAISADHAAILAKAAELANLAPVNKAESDGTATYASAPAGLFYAQVVPATADYLYNTIFVGADFKSDNNTNSIAANTAKVGGETNAIAKKEQVTLTKESHPETADSATGADNIKYDHNVGDVIPFKITSTIPAYGEGYQDPQYEITDSLETGLALSDPSGTVLTDATVASNITVAVADISDFTGGGTDYSVALTTDGFKVTLTPAGIAKVAGKGDSGKKITITYNAKITSLEGATVTEKTNTATVKFSNKPTDSSSYSLIEDRTRHYTFSIDASLLGKTGEAYTTDELVKVGLGADGKPLTEKRNYHSGTTWSEQSPLQGAKFALFKASPEAADYASETAAKASSKIYTNTYDEGGTTKTFDGIVTSDAMGRLNINGLDAGTYYLREVEAPTGYIKDDRTFTITIEATYEDIQAGSYMKDVNNTPSNATDDVKVNYGAYKVLQGYTVKVNDGTVDRTSSYTITKTATPVQEQKVDKATYQTITGEGAGEFAGDVMTPISNTQGTELPSTGGIGTTIFYVVGAILVIGAGVVLITRRRMDA